MNYETAKGNLAQLDARLQAAWNNDVQENLLVTARMLSDGNLLAPAIGAAMMADAFAVYQSAAGRLRQIREYEAWLDRSASSATELTTAIEGWSDIGVKQSHIIAQIAAGKNRLSEGEWRGMSRGDHLAEVAKKQEKEAAFAKSLACLVDGCRMALDLTDWIMLKVSSHATAALLNTASATTRPSAASGQPRNWRLREVESRFGTLASHLLTLRNKGDWSSREKQIVDIFQEHADTLAALHTRGGGGRLTMYAM